MPAIPPAPITYRFERGDVWRLAQAIYRPSWLKRLGMLALALAAMLGLVVYRFGGWPTGRQWAALLQRPGIVVLTVALVLIWANMHWVSILTLVARFKSFAVAEKEIVMSFSEAGLDVDVEDVASHIPWTKFTARIEKADRLLLRLARWEVFTIPRRACPDEASWQRALAFVREKVPHVG